jgi:two-component system response regulator DctR
VYGSVRPGNAAVELPKGLSEITLEQMVGYLSTATAPFTAEQVAAGVGVTRNTARRYLEHLMRQGKVRRHARYGTVGRPEHWYTVCRPLG